MKSIEWLAGLVDAEGSFYLTYTSKGTRVVNFSISMTDLLPIKHASELLQLQIEIQKPTGNAKQCSYRIRARCTKIVVPIIEMLLPYLVTKKNAADILLQISNIVQKHINDPSYKYSIDDKLELIDLEEKLIKCNVGCPEYCGNPIFSFDWLAGMTDGDGSVYFSKCKIQKREFHRLVYKISLKDQYTINYINNSFNRKNSNNPFQDKRPNRNKNYTFRLISSQASTILMKLDGKTITKERQIELGLELNSIRSSRTVESNQKRINEMILEMKSLNKN